MNTLRRLKTNMPLNGSESAPQKTFKLSQVDMLAAGLIALLIALVTPSLGQCTSEEFNQFDGPQSRDKQVLEYRSTAGEHPSEHANRSRSSALFVGPSLIQSLAQERATVSDNDGERDKNEIQGLKATLEWQKFDGLEARPDSVFNKNSIENTIPTDIPNHADGKDVGQRVMNKGLQSLVEGRYFNNPELARAAKEIEQKLKTEVSIGGREPGSVAHSFGMQVLAFEQRAKLDYKGFFDASMDYNASNSNFQMALSEQLSPTSKLLLNHESSTDTSMLNLHFDWN